MAARVGLERPTGLVALTAAFDPESVRADFPALAIEAYGKPLAYLDNAATTHKPRAVLDAVVRHYETSNANVHRGLHLLAERATAAYEGARVKVQRFVNAELPDEIVFVRGCTEAINLVAASFGRVRVGSGDEILVSEMEHHSNIVPWQLLATSVGATLRPIPITDDGELDLEAFGGMLGPRTRLVAVTHVSNALGSVVPVATVCAMARAAGVPILIDGAQAAPHLPIDVQALGCDFYTLSGHKVYAPTGIGALYGRRELLDAMPPYQGGGEMIRSVSFRGTTFNEVPFKFEAGTPNIAGAIGFGAALDYLSGLDREAIAAHESALLRRAIGALARIPGVRLIGQARERTSLVSFVMEGIHPHDIGTVLDREGIAIRAGHHCAQPVMERFGVPATARASFALYNTSEEVDRLAAGLARVRELFG